MNEPIEEVRRRIASALEALEITAAPGEIAFERPASAEHGDYSTNAALVFAKRAARGPRELAEEIVRRLGDIQGLSFEIAPPGFINFRVREEELARGLTRACADEAWGSSPLFTDEVILVEYTSPNLFKPLHVGNLVGNIVGESLQRLMRFCGGSVVRVNYPADIGLPVAKALWGVRSGGYHIGDIHQLGEAYRVGNEAYEGDMEKKNEIDAINRALYAGDPDLEALRVQGVETSRRRLAELCAALGTEFDFELFESETAPRGKAIVLAHLDDGIFERSQGAIVFPGERYGLHTRVFINSDGLPTYEAKDIGNFDMKRERFPKWKRSLIVTGSEQSEYFKVIFEAIRHICTEAKERELRHIATGFLSLTTGKMSTRKGNVLTGESLLAELALRARARAQESRAPDVDALARDVAAAALKYQILRQGTGSNIVFDVERALSLEGDSGPYLQYAHARMSAIIAKAHEAGVAPRVAESEPQSELARLVYRFPEIVSRAASEREPHYLATYLIELAGAFNSWYAKEQILDGTDAAARKVALTDATRRTLARGLWLLGIPAPERM